MIRRAALALAALLWLGLAHGEEWISARVVSVTDGDTAVVETSQKKIIRVRFYGVDAPETANRLWPAQPYSEAAKRYMRGEINERAVRIRLTGARTYGREVGEIFVKNRSASRALVRVGLGWWNRKYAPHDTELEHLQKVAQAARLGLWADATPVPPWRHRGRYRPKNAH
ncbi:MAG: hypothetical protein EXR83_12690 [Gammaproteobacteria bacterium]|nr:hypothetical protein [Gammaproteobacteria bacterium]